MGETLLHIRASRRRNRKLTRFVGSSVSSVQSCNLGHPASFLLVPGSLVSISISGWLLRELTCARFYDSFIWALITALVSRIMLHLRSVACASAHSRETFFGETAGSTRIAWARRTALESSFYAMSSVDGQAADPMEGSAWNTGYEESGEPLQLRKFHTKKSRLWN